jgi:hypothetical protein
VVGRMVGEVWFLCLFGLDGVEIAVGEVFEVVWWFVDVFVAECRIR